MGYKKVFMQIKNFGSARLELVTKLAILTRANRGVAQLGSASALGAEGRWFESSHPDHAAVVQLVEHQPSKLTVAGSSPVCRSIFLSSVFLYFVFFTSFGGIAQRNSLW